MMALKASIGQYELASSAKVNWEKSEGFIIGRWRGHWTSILPGGLTWGREGYKSIRCFFRKRKF